MLRYIESKVGNREDAEDILSVVFLKVCAGIEEFDGQNAAPLTWLWTITRHAIADYYREKARHPVDTYDNMEDVFSSVEKTEDSVPDEEMLDRLADALKYLSQRERDVIILSYYYEIPDREIAQRMHVTWNNLRQIKYKALNKLRKKLKN